MYTYPLAFSDGYSLPSTSLTDLVFDACFEGFRALFRVGRLPSRGAAGEVHRPNYAQKSTPLTSPYKL